MRLPSERRGLKRSRVGRLASLMVHGNGKSEGETAKKIKDKEAKKRKEKEEEKEFWKVVHEFPVHWCGTLG
jgi:hypothetical protein